MDIDAGPQSPRSRAGWRSWQMLSTPVRLTSSPSTRHRSTITSTSLSLSFAAASSPSTFSSELSLTTSTHWRKRFDFFLFRIVHSCWVREHELDVLFLSQNTINDVDWLFLVPRLLLLQIFLIGWLAICFLFPIKIIEIQCLQKGKWYFPYQ